MKPLNTLTGDALEQMIDYKVVDQTGASIGTLHSLWSDPTTGAVEFLGVKTGWLFGHNHVVPAEKAELDEANNVVRLPYTEVFIKEAPSMSADAEISEVEEDDIFRYYGLPRHGISAGSDTVGLPTDDAFAAGSSSMGTSLTEDDEADSSATYVGIPTKIKDTIAQQISITDRGEATANSYRLRKTARPITALGGVDESPESVSTIERMALPTSDDFINGGAAAVATSASAGTHESSDYAPTSGPLGDTSLSGSTGVADDIGGNASTTLTTGSEEYTDTDGSGPLGSNQPSENIDPLSGEHGAHPVGTGVGATGAGVAGAALGGAVGGPVGAVIGGIAGAISGGLAGKGVAESINPTVENAYWQANYTNAPYYHPDYAYDDYEPAYRVGYEAYGKIPGIGQEFGSAEPHLERKYQDVRGASRLEWEKAKHATKDAWERAKSQVSDVKPPQS